MEIPYVIYTTTKIFMLVVLRVKKSSSMSMEEFFFKPKAKGVKLKAIFTQSTPFTYFHSFTLPDFA
jgi:hypothetical protein